MLEVWVLTVPWVLGNIALFGWLICLGIQKLWKTRSPAYSLTIIGTALALIFFLIGSAYSMHLRWEDAGCLLWLMIPAMVLAPNLTLLAYMRLTKGKQRNRTLLVCLGTLAAISIFMGMISILGLIIYLVMESKALGNLKS